MTHRGMGRRTVGGVCIRCRSISNLPSEVKGGRPEAGKPGRAGAAGCIVPAVEADAAGEAGAGGRRNVSLRRIGRSCARAVPTTTPGSGSDTTPVRRVKRSSSVFIVLSVCALRNQTSARRSLLSANAPFQNIRLQKSCRAPQVDPAPTYAATARLRTRRAAAPPRAPYRHSVMLSNKF